MVVGHVKDGFRILRSHHKSEPTPIWNGAAGLRVACGTRSMIAEVVQDGAARLGDVVVRLDGR